MAKNAGRGTRHALPTAHMFRDAKAVGGAFAGVRPPRRTRLLRALRRALIGTGPTDFARLTDSEETR